MIYLTVLPRASNAGLQSPIWTRLRCYVIFLSVESTLADEKWLKCWFSIPYSFTDLKEGFTRRKYIRKYLNGRLDRKYCMLWDFQIPNSKKGDLSLENGITGKIRMPSEWYICYLVHDSDPFYRLQGELTPITPGTTSTSDPETPLFAGRPTWYQPFDRYILSTTLIRFIITIPSF